MIVNIKYVCPEDSKEKAANVIKTRLGISYNVYEGDTAIEGMVSASAYHVIKCDCGNEHEFLAGDKSIHL